MSIFGKVKMSSASVHVHGISSVTRSGRPIGGVTATLYIDLDPMFRKMRVAIVHPLGAIAIEIGRKCVERELRAARLGTLELGAAGDVAVVDGDMHAPREDRGEIAARLAEILSEDAIVVAIASSDLSVDISVRRDHLVPPLDRALIRWLTSDGDPS